MRAVLPDRVAAGIGRIRALDPFADELQAAVRELVPEDSAAKEALSGTWLGHPLHPLLTDLVIGSWTSAFVLDMRGPKRRRAADDLVAFGVLAALPTAFSGLSDYAELSGRTRRVGTAHALGNASALTLQALSWRARRRRRRTAGVVLSVLGILASTCSAWLGGHLSFGEGVGVDQTSFEDAPTSWTPLIDESKLGDDAPVRRSAAGTGVLLVKHRGRVHALVDRCSHRGCSLSEGSLSDSAITCPCHGSRFALDGTVLHGPATARQPTLEVRIRDGRVEVRASPAG